MWWDYEDHVKIQTVFKGEKKILGGGDNGKLHGKATTRYLANLLW